MAIDAKSRKPLLRMGSQYRGEIYCAGPLRSVKSPHALDCMRVHVHGLCTVTPAWGHSQGNIHSGPAEFIRTGSAFPHPPNGGIRNHYVYRFPIAVTQVFPKQGRRAFGHIHGLSFHGFPYFHISLSSVYCGSDADDRISPDQSVCCHSVSSFLFWDYVLFNLSVLLLYFLCSFYIIVLYY